MIKKGFQIGFAIALGILSVICTVWKNDILGGVVYAVVIPSFILTIISFVIDISNSCKNYAEKITSLSKEEMEKSLKLYKFELDKYKAGKLDVEYLEGYVPLNIAEKHRDDSLKHGTKILASQDVTIFFLRCQYVCSIIVVIGYVLLVLCLALSYYVAKLLSAIDLNCITLWSTALLYVTLELKQEACDFVFKVLYKIFIRHNQKMLDKELKEICTEIEDSAIEQ